MTPAQVIGKTSQEVRQSGTYGPECCNVEMFFEKGMTFQRCPKCERLAEWQLVVIQQGKVA